MLSRDEAIVLLKKYIREDYYLRRSYIVESILKKLAKRLNKDEQVWGLTGLLHNIDYEYTSENFQERGLLAEKILSGLIPEEGINAIKGNNYLHTNYAPVTSLDRSLIATTELTELIFEIIKYSKKHNITIVDVKGVYEKYKDEDNFPDINRKRIKIIEDVGIDIEEFIKISLYAIIKVKDQINL